MGSDENPGLDPQEGWAGARSSAWPAWVAITLFYLAVRLPLLDIPLDRDEGAFGVVGQAIWRGELPYRDIFDHKPPGVYYIYALALTFFQPTARGMHTFLQIWNFATLLILADWARRVWGVRAGRWTGWWYAFASAVPTMQGFTASTEMFMLLPLAAGLRLLWAGESGGAWRRRAALLGSGACGAAACWIKQPAAMSLLSVPVFLAWKPSLPKEPGAGLSRGMDWKQGARESAWWLAGGVALSLAVLAPFLWAGAGRELYYWSFTHNFLYGATAGKNGWPELWSSLVLMSPDLGPLLGLTLAAGSACFLMRPGAAGESSPSLWPVWLLLLCSFLGAGLSRFFYLHYFSQILPALTLAAGVSFARLQDRGRSRHPARVRAGLIAGILLPLAVTVWTRPWYWWQPVPEVISIRMLGRQAFEAGPQVAQYIEQRTRPEDWIFIFGSEAQIAFQARRRNANLFVTAYALTGPWPRQREFQERTWETIQRVRPEYLVLPYTPYTLMWDPQADRFLAERLNELGRSSYRLEACVAYIKDQGLRLVNGVSDRQRQEERQAIPIELWRRIPEGRESEASSSDGKR